MGQTGNQSNLSKGIVQNFIIKLPSLKEQSAIAQILTDMDNEITILEQKMEKYKKNQARHDATIINREN